MGEIGYRVMNESFSCPESKGKLISNAKNYQYCIFEHDTCSKNSDKAKCGKYYEAIAYMYFDVPIIGDMIRIPVNGETMTFNEINS